MDNHNALMLRVPIRKWSELEDSYGYTRMESGRRRKHPMKDCKCASDNRDLVAPCQVSFRCPACNRFRPLCFGGAPDPRCDECWAKDRPVRSY